MSLFGNNSEVNGISTRDALQSIVKFAKILEENTPSSANLAGRPGLTDQARDQLVKEALLNSDGKVALGQAMALPIRRNLDYSGIARRTLVVDNLAQGALPVYERDIDVSAVVVSSFGSAPESVVRGDRVTIPEIEIASNPLVRIREVRQRRFNVIERTVQKAKQEIN